MNLQQMINLTIIEQEGNISKAAERLFVTQPALSRQLKSIEKELGFCIFDRGTVPLSLTQAGYQYMNFVRKMVYEHTQVQKRISDIKNLQSGRLNIGITSNIGLYFFPHILSGFTQRYPDVHINITEFQSITEIESLLASGDLDLGCLTIQSQSPQINFEPLLKVETLLALPCSLYSVSDKTDACIDIHKLQATSFILMKKPFALRRIADHFFDSLHIDPPVILETSSTHSAYHLAAKNVGATFIYDFSAALMNLAQPPILRPLFPEPLFHWLGFTYNKDKYIDHTMKAFIDHVKKCIKEDKPQF